MAKKDNKTEQVRDIPISLQGIETILLYLKEQDKDPSSIRGISQATGISMRVVKNILLQLERFNQVERIIEDNRILPKWKISKFGKKVLKEAKGIENNIKFPNTEAELIDGINIPDDLDELKALSKDIQDSIINKLRNLQTNFSKILGTVLDLDNPVFEELIGIIINRIKFVKQRVSNLVDDPIAIKTLKKKGDKTKKITNEEAELLFTEIVFFNSVIRNELKRIDHFNHKIKQFIENDAATKAYSIAQDAREDLRTLVSMLNCREALQVEHHSVSIEDLKKLKKNKINSGILENLIELPISIDEKLEVIEETVLKYHASIAKELNGKSDSGIEIKETIPLYAFYQIILDDKPNVSFTMDQMEKAIKNLADKGIIPGIRLIGNEENSVKVVQLKERDITSDETTVVKHAISLDTFTLADMIDATNWQKEKVLEILYDLTEVGVLRHSKSLLHGERWFILSEKNS